MNEEKKHNADCVFVVVECYEVHCDNRVDTWTKVVEKPRAVCSTKEKAELIAKELEAQDKNSRAKICGVKLDVLRANHFLNSAEEVTRE